MSGLLGWQESAGEAAWARFHAQHQAKPRTEGFVKAFYQPLGRLNLAWEQLLQLRAIDTAAGAQLDGVGQILGLARVIDGLITVPFFGFASQPAGRNFGVARMRRPGEAWTASANLPDSEYRRLLKAKVLLNNGHGTQRDIVEAAKILLGVEYAYAIDDAAESGVVQLYLGYLPDLGDTLWSVFGGMLPRLAGVRIEPNYWLGGYNPLPPDLGGPTPEMLDYALAAGFIDDLAFGTVRLHEAYTGPALTVERSSDGEQAEIGFVTDGTLDEAALTAFCGAGDGHVVIWHNQGAAGPAFSASQPAAAARPRIVNAGVVDTLNGVAAMHFDGADDFLEVPTYVFNAGAITVLAAAEASASGALVANDAGTGGRTVLFGDGRVSLGDTTTTETAVAGDTSMLIGTKLDSGPQSSRIDGVQGAAVLAVRGIQDMGMRIGAETASAGFYSGLVGAVAVARQAITAPQARAVETTVGEHFGVVFP